MSTMAIVIDVNFLEALILAVAGVVVYEVSPPATLDKGQRVSNAVYGLVAFFLLWLASGGTAIEPVTAYAYFSAGFAPNEVLSLYRTHTTAPPTPPAT